LVPWTGCSRLARIRRAPDFEGFQPIEGHFERFVKKIWCSAIKCVDERFFDLYRRVRLLQCTNAQEPQMSVIERSQSFVKELNELNVNSVKKYFEIQREAVEQYVGANRARFTALREMKGVEDLVTAQREYYAAVQKNVADSVKKQADLVRENFTTGGKLVRELFNRDSATQA
jgi:hypothetical protein